MEQVILGLSIIEVNMMEAAPRCLDRHWKLFTFAQSTNDNKKDISPQHLCQKTLSNNKRTVNFL